VSAVDSTATIPPRKVYMQDMLPIDIGDVPSPDVLRQYPHLCHLIGEMPSRNETVPIGLLICVNCPRAMEPQKFTALVDNSPYAVKTGPLNEDRSIYDAETLLCNRITSTEHRLRVSETDLREMLQLMYGIDFTEPASKTLCQNWPPSSNPLSSDGRLSQEDQRFLDVMEAESKLVDGHYQLPLPFRHDNVQMPNNRSLAVQRAASVKRKLAVNPQYKNDYTKFISDMIDKKYARRVMTTEPNRSEDQLEALVHTSSRRLPCPEARQDSSCL
jgi:hypothetical protein